MDDFVLFQGSVRVPWLSFAKCLPLYALTVAHFTCTWGYYTLLTCLPLYFKHILQFDMKSVSANDCIIVENFTQIQVGLLSLSSFILSLRQQTF